MTINIISDTHYEIRNGKVDYGLFDLKKLKPADVLVIAGDLSQRESEYEEIKNDVLSKATQFKRVLFIKGNHDYWMTNAKRSDIKWEWISTHTVNLTEEERDMPQYFGQKTRITEYPSIDYRKQYVSDEKIDEVIDGIRFLGTTLWSPIPAPEEDYYVARECEECMNDYHCIPWCTSLVTTSLYRENAAWLKQRVSEAKANGEKVVVITHHVPREELIHPTFKGDVLNAAFVVLDHSLDDCKPDLWICGHTHQYGDQTIDGVRYFKNPIGYNYASWHERDAKSINDYEIKTDEHWYDSVVEV